MNSTLVTAEQLGIEHADAVISDEAIAALAALLIDAAERDEEN